MSTSVWTRLRALMPQPIAAGFPADTVVLFPPRDDARAALELLIAAATKSIKIEMFTYCDAAIDAAIKVKTAVPGFVFQATFDGRQAVTVPSMAKLVAGWDGNAAASVAVGRSEKGQIIHRKVMLVDGEYVVGGSTNLTFDGERLEDNELVIRRNRVLAGVYGSVLDANHARLVAGGSL